ncbi:hypothetical protein ACVIHF_000627 [Bradyrhizobium sp. USDA 4506]
MAREDWFEGQDLDPERLVFIDETAAKPKWRAFTVARPGVSDAVRPSRMDIGRRQPSLLDFARMVLLRRLCWTAPWMEMLSLPTSNNCLRHHYTLATSSSWTTCPLIKFMACERPIQAVGASLLYLPPYSPDFNPIEMAFSKLKALLRAAAARSMPDLWQAIANAINRFTPDECRNYLAAAGHDAT